MIISTRDCGQIAREIILWGRICGTYHAIMTRIFKAISITWTCCVWYQVLREALQFNPRRNLQWWIEAGPWQLGRWWSKCNWWFIMRLLLPTSNLFHSSTILGQRKSNKFILHMQASKCPVWLGGYFCAGGGDVRIFFFENIQPSSLMLVHRLRCCLSQYGTTFFLFCWADIKSRVTQKNWKAKWTLHVLDRPMFWFKYYQELMYSGNQFLVIQRMPIIWVSFSHLRLWIAVARHNLKRLKI